MFSSGTLLFPRIETAVLCGSWRRELGTKGNASDPAGVCRVECSETTVSSDHNQTRDQAPGQSALLFRRSLTGELTSVE